MLYPLKKLAMLSLVMLILCTGLWSAQVQAAKVQKKMPTATQTHNALPESGAALASRLASDAVLVQDVATGAALLAKDPQTARPIASISKLMTAMVVLDAHQSLTEKIRVTEEDVDRLKFSSSKLDVGTELSRSEMLRLTLMASENRAAHALARTYPGGVPAFVAAMNKKAKALGLHATFFGDPTGLNPKNVASPEDLARLVQEASTYQLIRRYSTEVERKVDVVRAKKIFHNTNPLVRHGLLDVVLQKTGYITEAGRCVVMQAFINHRPTRIVLLNAEHSDARLQDALTIKRWLERLPHTT